MVGCRETKRRHQRNVTHCTRDLVISLLEASSEYLAGIAIGVGEFATSKKHNVPGTSSELEGTRYQRELEHTSLHLRRKCVARLVWDIDSVFRCSRVVAGSLV